MFPTRYKAAVFTLLLKKSGLDSASTANYRPISNLNNISKIMENLFKARTATYHLLPKFQSAPVENYLAAHA